MRSFALPLAIVLAASLTGCPDRHPADDAGIEPDANEPDAFTPPVDAGPDEDAFVPDDTGVPDDAGTDADVDGGTTPGGSVAAPAAEITRMGTGGFLLRGTVLAPSGPILDGEVLIVGDTITCVAADCTTEPMADTVTVIDTHATISPGLIDGHNHLSYNFLPEWAPSDMRLFLNRYEWRADPEYLAHREPEARLETWGSGDPRNQQHMCAALLWGELRSIVHGTTTVQGQSPNRTCIQGLVRNADHTLGFRVMPSVASTLRTTISGACETSLNDAARVSLVTSFRNGTATRHAIHMGEGYAGGGVATDPTRELDCYAGRHRATTSLLFDTDGTPFNAALFIHAVPLDEDDLIESMMAGAHFVWSPSSNILLYGRTAPIGRMLELGLPVGLGPDWTLSGSDELLSEMRFALDWAAAETVPEVTPESLVEMATEGGADATDTSLFIGRLAPGLRADVVVFGRTAADPYLAVTDSRAVDVRLVMIDGAAYYGDLALEAATSVNSLCDNVDACGTAKFLCVAGTTGESVADIETVDEIETFLRNYLATGWIDDGTPRAFLLGADDLAPLIDCTL